MTSQPSQRRRDKDFLLAMSVKEKRSWAKSIVLRLMKAWQVEEMQDIAQFVGGHLRMPSAWIQKGFVPWEVLYTCHLETGCSLDWLYNGKQPALPRTQDLEKRIQATTKVVLDASGDQLNIIQSVQTNGFTIVSKSIASALMLELSSELPKLCYSSG